MPTTEEMDRLRKVREDATAAVQTRAMARATEIRQKALADTSVSNGSETMSNNSTNISSNSGSSGSSGSTDSSSSNTSNFSIYTNSSENEDVAPYQSTDPYKDIMLMNIAGEIVNLEGRTNNSGRISLDQLKMRYTADDSEIILLKKVFGIPTLRHTPTLLTKEGCSLDKHEASIIRKVLQKRRKDLERGASFSKGLTLDSTRQKIRNLELLLKRIEELIGVEKDPCEPSKLSIVSVPSMTMPSLSKLFPKQDDSTEKLLILILVLLLGVASDKVRSRNIKERLGSDTIEGIVKAIQTKSVQPKNITTLLEKVTDGLSGSTSFTTNATATATNAAASITDPILRKSYESLIQEFDDLKNNFNKLSTDKATLEGELAGKAAAITVLEKQLEDVKSKSSRIAEEAMNSLKRPQGPQEELDAARKQKQLFEEQIRALEDERLDTNMKLQDITEKFNQLVNLIKENHTKIRTTKAEVESAFAAKEAEHQETLLQKQQILEERETLRATLKSKNESVDAVTNEITSLREQLRKTTEELNTERRAKSDAISGLNALESDDTSPVSVAVDVAVDVAEKTKIESVLEALRKIYDTTHDANLLVQIEKLQGSLELKGVPANSVSAQGEDEVFSNRLKSLLVQLALLDEEQQHQSTETLSPLQGQGQGQGQGREILEPVRERLCLLYYFSEMHWKLIKARIEQAIRAKQTSQAGSQSVYSKEFILTIDKIFFPELKDSDLWSTIATLGKVIAALGKEKGVVPSEARNMIQQLAKSEAEQNAKNALNYRQALTVIRGTTDSILPKGNTYIDPNTLEIKKKTTVQLSILEAPYLYILELKLISRYVNYILMNSPHKLECQGLQPIEQS